MFKKKCNCCEHTYYAKDKERMKKYFYSKRGCKDGLRAICKVCFKKQYYDKDKMKEQNKNRYIKQNGGKLLLDQKRVCPVCNKGFKPKTHNQIYCGDEYCTKIKNRVYNRKYNKKRAKDKERVKTLQT